MQLKEAVKEIRADLGIAFDGDADRVGAVDENGQVIWGDYLLIFAREILTRKPGSTFIGEVKCSQILYDEIERLGGKAIMYRTGHSLIKARMKKSTPSWRGDERAPFLPGPLLRLRRCPVLGCRLMEIVSNSGWALSAQLEGLPTTVSTRDPGRLPDEVKFDVINRVVTHFKQSKYKVVDVDGVRVSSKKAGGRGASNTQPVLVMRFEAENGELLKQYQAEVEAA